MEGIDLNEPPTAAFDLAIIGGGPAGTAAAITAARGGRRVLVIERGRLPRQRVCGEFVSPESLDLLAGLLRDTAPRLFLRAPRIAEARLFLDGHTISAGVDPPAASIARYDLDGALWHAAEKAGVRALLETGVDRITSEGPFTLFTSAGDFRAHALIDASGRWSNLRSHGNHLDGKKWLGVKAHYAEENPHPSVDLYFFDGGYCGVQPVRLAEAPEGDLHVNACAMVRSDVARTLPEIWERHPDLRTRARGWQSLMEPVSTSPLIFREPEPVRGNILQAGDAAGFVDPFVGDGISLALRSGALAANCLLPFFEHEISLSEAARAYAHAYRRQLLPVFRNSTKLRRLLSLPRPVRQVVVHLLEVTPGASRLLVRMTR
ncbi:MAG TPA: FAD-dependent oxidoreductase [Terriglobales bacterium]|nr:FAD-dependent oxidoreductase [Terriglobales bacterium]